jgi:hypothetical protein
MNDATDSAPPILSVTETLRLLGNAIPRSTFNAMLNRGEVDGLKLGGRWYVHTTWIEGILKSAVPVNT